MKRTALQLAVLLLVFLSSAWWDGLNAQVVVARDTFTYDICIGDTFRNNLVNADTVYNDTFPAFPVGDSIVTEIVTARPTYDEVDSVEICENESYIAGGGTQTTSGTYRDTFSSQFGCDSIVVTELLVKEIYDTLRFVTTCSNEPVFLEGANQTTSGFYIDTFTRSNGCDSVILTLLTVIDTMATTVDQEVCEGDTINVYGVDYTPTNDTSIVVQDSFNAGLVFCDNIVTTNITVLRDTSVTIDTSICEGDSIFLQGNWQTMTGTFSDTFSRSTGCDSVVTTNLTVIPPIIEADTIVICEGDSAFLGGAFQTSPGDFSDTFVSFEDCDSIVNTRLEVIVPIYDTIPEELCDGDSILIGGEFRTTDGLYNDTFQSFLGCDSLIRTTDLTFEPEKRDTFDIDICQGETYFAAGANQDATGEYIDTFAGVSCDSIVVTNLTVFDTFYAQIDTTLCDGDSIFVDGAWRFTDGTFTDSFNTVDGCDSVFDYNLTFIVPLLPVVDTNLCFGDSIEILGTFYSDTATVFDTIKSVQGCDSIITQYNIQPNDTFRFDIADTLCQGETFSFGGMNYSPSADTAFSVEYTTVNGCDSIYDIDLVVNDTFRDQFTDSICQGQSFTFNGSTFFPGADTAFTASFSTVDGCDSIWDVDVTVFDTFRFSIEDTICAGDTFAFGGTDYTPVADTAFSVNYTTVDGCDSIYDIDITVNDSFTTTIEDTICQGESYTFSGTTYNPTDDTSITVVFNTVDGCDSVFELEIFVADTFNFTFTDSICQGDFFTFDGTNYFPAADTAFTANYTSQFGCDSSWEVTVTVFDTFRFTVNDTICEGQTYTFGGINYNPNDDSTFSVSYNTVDGCDSVYDIFLVVTDSFRQTIDDTICQGEVYTFGGINYVPTTDSSFQQLYTTQDGCDSIYDINVVVNDTFNDRFPDTICAGEVYTATGGNYTATGTYTDTFSSTDGCDSFVTVDLTVLDTFYREDTVVLCEGQTYTVGSNTYDSTDIYVDVLTAQNGCDSVVYTDLTILENPRETDSIQICQGDSVFLQGAFQDTAGEYFDTFAAFNGCDSILTTILTVDTFLLLPFPDTICEGDTFRFNSIEATTAGSYFDTVDIPGGCDSIYRVDLAIEPTRYDTTSREICVGDSAFIGGEFRSSPGLYNDTLVSSTGCDSVLTTDLQFDTLIEAFDTVAICQGETYFAGGANQSMAGTYFDTTTSFAGCDSATITTLIVNDTFLFDTAVSFCAGGVYTATGQAYDTSGVYQDSFSSVDGCDSVVRTTLTVYDTFYQVFTDSICQGQSYSFDGNTFFPAADTSYEVDYTTVDGCDSTWFVDISVFDTFRFTVNDTICEGETYTYDGVNYNPNDDSTWTVIYSTVDGCDSLYDILLVVTDTFRAPVQDTICQGATYTFGGVNYNPNDDTAFQVNYLTVDGCDSIYDISVVVVDTFFDTFTDSICQGSSFSFAGQTYFPAADTSFTASYTTEFGCDSNWFVDVTVFDTFRFTVNDTICEGETYTFDGVNYNPNDDSTWTVSYSTVDGCDSLYDILLVVTDTFRAPVQDTICEGGTYTFGGVNYNPNDDTAFQVNYLTVDGCDSIYDITVVVVDTFFDTFTDSICQGSSFSFAGQTYFPAADTSFTASYTTEFGCDSNWFVDVTVFDTFRFTVNDTICEGETYTFDGVNYNPNDDSTWTVSYSTVDGCDSLYDILLVVTDTFRAPVQDTICEGGTYTFGGVNYNPNDDTAFQVNYLTVDGCDSIYDITVVVVDTFFDTFTDSICQGGSFSFAGQTFFPGADTSFTASYTTEFGCDSNWFVDVTVFDSSRISLFDTICQGELFNFDGVDYTAFADTLFEIAYVDQNGCDSTYEVFLTVNDTFRSTIQDTICQGETYTFAGVNYNPNDDTAFTVTFNTVSDCDSNFDIRILVVDTFFDTFTDSICQGGSFSFAGQTFFPGADTSFTASYSNQFGCDSNWFVDVTVFDTFRQRIDDTICQGELFTFDGVNYTAFADSLFDISYTTADGCDSVYEVLLVVNDTFFDVVDTAQLCRGETYDFGGLTYLPNQDTFWFVDYLTVDGCDSQYLVRVLVSDTFFAIDSASICQGDSYTFGGITYIPADDTIFNVDYVSSEGCDSTYEVRIVVSDTFYELIDTVRFCFGNSYTFDGVNYAPTQDTIFFVNYASSLGCDSIYEIRIDVDPTFDLFDTLEFCQGDTFDFNGSTLDATGDYVETFTTVDGCDSVVRLRAVFNDTFRFAVNDTICEGEVFSFGGINYAPADDSAWTVSYLSTAGCDSVYDIDLVVFDTQRTVLADTFCQGDTFAFGGQTIDVGGVYFDTLATFEGCDSIVEYSFVFNDTFRVYDTQRICQGDTFLLNGTPLFTAGNYADTVLQTVNGCDSTIELVLVVNDTFRFSQTPTICRLDTFFFGGNFYNPVADTSFQVAYTTVDGCDSLYDIDITVLDSFYVILTDTQCQGITYVYQGNTFVASTPQDTSIFLFNTAVNGCDSTTEIRVNIPIQPITSLPLNPCEGDSITVGDTVIVADAGTYTFTRNVPTVDGCDSLVVLNIIGRQRSFNGAPFGPAVVEICEYETFEFKGVQLNTSGFYYDTFTNAVGCDSIIELNLQVNSYEQRTIDLGELCSNDFIEINGVFYRVDSLPEPFIDTALSSGPGCDTIQTYSFEKVPSVAEPLIYLPDTFDITVPRGTGITFSLQVDNIPDGLYIWRNLTDGFSWNDPSFTEVPTSDVTTYTSDFIWLCDTITRQYTVTLIDPAAFVLPKAFTPNNDGINDDYYVIFERENFRLSEIEEFTIFNQWGLFIREVGPGADTQGSGWDGRDMNGNDMPAGTYLWRLVIRVDGELQAYTGTVTLIR